MASKQTKRFIALSVQFNSNCPTLTPKVTSSKKLSQCRECMYKQKRFQFTLENVRVCYFLNCMGQAVPSFGPSMRKTAFAKLQRSCQRFITVSPGRSETDSERDICSGSNEIRNTWVRRLWALVDWRCSKCLWYDMIWYAAGTWHLSSNEYNLNSSVTVTSAR